MVCVKQSYSVRVNRWCGEIKSVKGVTQMVPFRQCDGWGVIVYLDRSLETFRAFFCIIGFKEEAVAFRKSVASVLKRIPASDFERILRGIGFKRL